jgi:hypothetical protein
VRRMRHVSKRYQLVASAFVPLLCAASTNAFAQANPGGSGSSGSAGASSVTTSAAPTVNAPLYSPFVAPPTDPNAPIGGGNTANDSSARPVSGDREDGFDLGPKGNAGGTAFGGNNGPIFMGGRGGGGDSWNHGTRIGTDSRVHTVRRGDTLWDICDAYFKNPYQWPRLWSYNPEIENPHWIFPGEQIRLYPGAQLAAGTTPQGTGPGGLVTRARTFGPDTVFLRDTGFIDSGDLENYEWGTINGSREDKLFLSDYDETYVHIGSKHNVNIGDELTVFRKVRQAGNGDVIQIQGTLRIDDWNPRERMARARVIESLDPIERGAEVGPVQRKFEVVSPVRNENEAQAHIIASVHPHDFWGADQIVFIDQGSKAGLVPGNRLFIVRRGDAYHQSLPAASASLRIAVEDPSPAATEHVPKYSDSRYPEEVVGEIRILQVRPESSTALVTASRREVELDDVVVARKGY